jgi:hypothetical protein
MKRPSFQFYPADWRNNAKLRRCSEAARGAWMDVLCVLHDSDEYGVCRWPLADIARAAGVPIKYLKELAEKGVLKGADTGATPYVYTPRHAGKAGDPVTLVEAGEGPCWYCSRFVRDEWVRQRRGQGTRFTDANQPTKGSTDDGDKGKPKTTPNTTPKGGIGDRQGDGPTSPSTSKPYSVPNGTGGTPPGVDPADALFQIAVPWLVERGVKESNARSLLGGARKQLGDAEAWNLASACMTEKPLEPAAWIAGALNKQMGRKNGATRHGNFSKQDYHAGVAADGTF